MVAPASDMATDISTHALREEGDVSRFATVTTS